MKKSVFASVLIFIVLLIVLSMSVYSVDSAVCEAAGGLYSPGSDVCRCKIVDGADYVFYDGACQRIDGSKPELVQAKADQEQQVIAAYRAGGKVHIPETEATIEDCYTKYGNMSYKGKLYECLDGYALERRDVNLCPKDGDEFRYPCLSKMAKLTDDPSICWLMRSRNKADCLGDFAYRHDDTAFCTNLTGDEPQYCLYMLVFYSKDAGNCDLMAPARDVSAQLIKSHRTREDCLRIYLPVDYSAPMVLAMICISVLLAVVMILLHIFRVVPHQQVIFSALLVIVIFIVNMLKFTHTIGMLNAGLVSIILINVQTFSYYLFMRAVDLWKDRKRAVRYVVAGLLWIFILMISIPVVFLTKDSYLLNLIGMRLSGIGMYTFTLIYLFGIVFVPLLMTLVTWLTHKGPKKRLYMICFFLLLGVMVLHLMFIAMNWFVVAMGP